MARQLAAYTLEALAAQDQWQTATAPISVGSKPGVLWLRLQLTNHGDQKQAFHLVVSPPRVKQVISHSMDANGRWLTQKNGAAVAGAMRPEAATEISFRHELAGRQQRTIWLASNW